MAPYDSDSSGGEEDDYTETNVLLGYASKEADEDTISYLGGWPTWLDPTSPPPGTLSKCKVCSDHLVLLLQLNADLPEQFPGHERRIYVFACRRKTCRRKEGSVRVFRGVRVEEVVKKEKEVEKKEEIVREERNLGSEIFGGKAGLGSGVGGNKNPFSMGGGRSGANPFASPSSTPANPFASKPAPPPAAAPAQSTLETASANLPKTFASALSLNSSHEADSKPKQFGPPTPWPPESAFPKPYTHLYLTDADYEVLDSTPLDTSSIPRTTMDLDEPSGSGGKEDKDVYESTIDKTFQRFADRLAQNPEQVIRYEFRGQPLLYSKNDAVGKIFSSQNSQQENVKVKTTGKGIPRCENCGRERVFEVQLTPHAISELERDEEGFDGMEWGTVVVGVCERDCVPEGTRGEVVYLEEWCGVQWEEVK